MATPLQGSETPRHIRSVLFTSAVKRKPCHHVIWDGGKRILMMPAFQRHHIWTGVVIHLHLEYLGASQVGVIYQFISEQLHLRVHCHKP